MKTVNQKGSVEFVLPVSGRFARIRPLSVLDLVKAWHENPMQMMVNLALLAVVLDDTPTTPPEVFTAMSPEEFGPILNHLSNQVGALTVFPKGVA